MSTPDIEGLLRSYEGPNRAHKSFRREFKYLNALYYLIVSSKDSLRVHLQNRMTEAEAAAEARGRDGAYALGIVSHSISTSQFQGICVGKPDAEIMVTNFDGFIDLLGRHCIISAHRIIQNFLTDLLISSDNRSLLSLEESLRQRLRNRRLSPSKIVKIYERFGEPVTRDQTIAYRLELLGETRNILEHNDGRATDKYLTLCDNPHLMVGDSINITSKEVGETFALIESTAASLNQRVLARLPVLADT